MTRKASISMGPSLHPDRHNQLSRGGLTSRTGRAQRKLSRKNMGTCCPPNAGGSHEGNRGLVADRPMRPNLVVVLAPILQLFAGVGKRQEPVSVQALGS